MTPSLLATHNRIIRGQNFTTSKMAQLRLSKSKWNLIKVETMAARDHMRRTGATATMNTARKRGMLFMLFMVF